MKRFLFLFLIIFSTNNNASASWFFNNRSSEKCNNNAKSSFIDLTKRSRKSVVVISANKKKGSGFVVRHEKGHTYILTNSHVIDGNKKVIVSWGDGREDVGNVIKDSLGESNKNDLALIKVEGIEGNVLPLDKKKLKVGSEVIAVGAPEGLDFSFTRGIISGLRVNKSLVQTDAAINPGNSGGPLITRNGCVVGINTFILKETEGLNFAISSEVISKFIENSSFKKELKKNKKLKKDYLYRAKALQNIEGQEYKIIALTTLALQEKETSEAYKLRAFAKNKVESSGEGIGVIEDLNWVLDKNDSDTEALLLRAITYGNENYRYLALNDFNKAISLGDKNQAISYLKRGIYKAFFVRDWDSGISDINRAIQIDPTNKSFYMARGYLYQYGGFFVQKNIDYKEAKANYERALKLSEDEKISKFVFNSIDKELLSGGNGQIYYQLGNMTRYDDPFGAIKAYTNGIESDPNKAELWRNRAQQYEKVKNYNAAIKDYLVAIKLYEATNLKPISSPYISVGRIYEKIGDFKKAIIFYSKNIEKNEDSSYSYELRAFALEKLNGKGSGCFDHKKAIQLGAGKDDPSYEIYVKYNCN